MPRKSIDSFANLSVKYQIRKSSVKTSFSRYHPKTWHSWPNKGERCEKTKTEDPSASSATPIVEEQYSDTEQQQSAAPAAPTAPDSEPHIPPPVPNHSTKPSSASWFTFDDIPRHKWSARLQEFTAWIDLQGTKPNAQPEIVLREFMARSTGSLRDWLESLGEYRQIQFIQAPVGTALNLIYEQFIPQDHCSLIWALRCNMTCPQTFKTLNISISRVLGIRFTFTLVASLFMILDWLNLRLWNNLFIFAPFWLPWGRWTQIGSSGTFLFQLLFHFHGYHISNILI